MPTGIYKRTERNRHTPETKELLRRINTGPGNPQFGKTTSQKQKEAARKRLLGNKYRLGHTMPEEEKQKRRILMTERNKNISEETKKKLSDSTKRLMSDPVFRERIAQSRRGKSATWVKGPLNPNWRGGTTEPNKAVRASMEYVQWRRSVFARDDYTCVICRRRGVSLQADHIKPFSLFPELRFDVQNGRTMCVGCHKNTDTYMWKIKKHPEYGVLLSKQ